MIRNEIRSIPFIRLCIPFCIGIIGAFEWNYSNRAPIQTPLILMIILCIICMYYIGSKFIKNFSFRIYNGLCVNSILIGLGFILSYQHYETSQSTHFSKKQQHYLHIEIDEEPRHGPKNIRFRARVLSNEHQEKLQGYLMVYVPNTDSVPLFYKSHLRIPSNYTEVSSPKNPGAFNYKRYLAVNNIFHQSYLKASQIYPIDYINPVSIKVYSNILCKNLIQVLRQKISDDEAYNMCAALILGYRAELDEELIRIYSDTGTIHILSVSGLHVGIIYIVLNSIASIFFRERNTRLIKVIVLIGCVWFYALLTGLSPSVCRSATMLSFTTVGSNFNRRSNAFNLLAASAFLLLSINPFYIFDIGFILSYLAVAGILYFQKGIYEMVFVSNKWADKLWLMAAVSIAAQLSTFPMSVYYFHKFPNYFLFANILVIPLSGFVLYTGMALLCIAFIPYLSDMFVYLLVYSIRLMNYILKFFASLPFATSDKLYIDVKEVIFYYLLCICLYIYITKKKPGFLHFSLVLVCILMSYNLYQKIHFRLNPELQIYHSTTNRLITWFNGDSLYLYHQDTLSAKDSALIQNASFIYHVENIVSLKEDKTYTQVKLKQSCLQMGKHRLLFLESPVDTMLIKNYSPEIIVCNRINQAVLQKILPHLHEVTFVITDYITKKTYKELIQNNKHLNIQLHATYLSGAYSLKK